MLNNNRFKSEGSHVLIIITYWAFAGKHKQPEVKKKKKNNGFPEFYAHIIGD